MATAAKPQRSARIDFAVVAATVLVIAVTWIGITYAVLIDRIIGSFRGQAQTELYQPVGLLRGVPQPAPLPLALEEERTISAEALAAADSYAEKSRAQALLVWHNDALQFARFYNGDAATRTDSLSMHKTLAALGIGAALDSGFIKNLDEPVGLYIREWRNDARGSMTIRDVLTMSTGIRAERMQRMPPNDFYRMMMGTDVTRGTLAGDLAEKPGEAFTYVNTNTQILEIILGRATGRAYADFVAEKIWAPLGNEDALLWLDHPGGSPRVFCCLMSNAENWLRLGRMIADEGRVGDRQVISQSFLREMRTAAKTNPNYGFQLWLGTQDLARFNGTGAGSIRAPSEPHLAADLLYLAGFGAQRTYVSPRCGLVIVRTGAQVFEWDDAVLPNTILRGLADKSCWQNAP